MSYPLDTYDTYGLDGAAAAQQDAPLVIDGIGSRPDGLVVIVINRYHPDGSCENIGDLLLDNRELWALIRELDTPALLEEGDGSGSAV